MNDKMRCKEQRPYNPFWEDATEIFLVFIGAIGLFLSAGSIIMFGLYLLGLWK